MIIKQQPIFNTRQQGSTLIVSLIIMILIMMLGITAVNTSDTQYKLAGNLQFEARALDYAETVIADAEQWLFTGTNFKNEGFTTYSVKDTPELYPIGQLAAKKIDPLKMTWDNSNSKQIPGIENQRYLIELISLGDSLPGAGVANPRKVNNCEQVNTYLITARGLSTRGAKKIVQSYFSKPSCT